MSVQPADLLVVAGGAGSRLGGVDKAMVGVPGGRPLLSRLLDAPVTGRRIVVGPVRDVVGVDVWAREEPPGGGPVAAIAAGIRHVDAGVVVVLAGDLPHGAHAVPALLDALPGHDAAVVESSGRAQWLLAAWRTAALRAAVTALDDPAGRATRALYADADAVRVPDPGSWSHDLDTPADLDRFRRG